MFRHTCNTHGDKLLLLKMAPWPIELIRILELWLGIELAPEILSCGELSPKNSQKNGHPKRNSPMPQVEMFCRIPTDRRIAASWQASCSFSRSADSLCAASSSLASDFASRCWNFDCRFCPKLACSSRWAVASASSCRKPATPAELCRSCRSAESLATRSSASSRSCFCKAILKAASLARWVSEVVKAPINTASFFARDDFKSASSPCRDSPSLRALASSPCAFVRPWLCRSGTTKQLNQP